MRFCSRFNATIADVDITKGTSLMTFNEKEKTFGGPIGLTMVNSIFLKRKSESQKFFFKYCKFVFTDLEGTFLSNGTFNGGENTSIGLLINNKADLLLRPKSIFLNPDLIDYSKVMTSDDFFIAHYIYKDNLTLTENFNLNSAINIFLISSDLLILFFLLYFASFIIGFIFFRCLPYFRKYDFNIFYSNFFEFRFELTRKKVTPLSFILIFNLFFMFLIRNFLANDINSKRVIVDKENLIYGVDKLYSINLNSCWGESYVVKLFKNSVKGSLENFIYFNKSLDSNNPCVLFKDRTSVAKPPYNFFLIGLNHHIPFLELLGGNNYDKDIFFNQQVFFSYNSLFYFSKKIDQIVKREVIKWLDIYFEHSFKQKVYRDGYEVVRTTSDFQNTIYYDVEQYIKEYTIIEGFNYAKFKDSFYLYLFLLIFYTFISLCLNIIAVFKLKYL